MKYSLRIVLVFILILGFTGISFSQRWKLLRYEVMGGVGSANVFGDIGGAATQSNLFGLKDLRIQYTRPSFSVGIRYKLQENMALKLNLIYGFAAESDKSSVNDTRRLSYTTRLFEQSLQYEYYFLKEDRRKHSAASYSRRGMINNYSRVAMYGFAGLGGLAYTPKLHVEGFAPPPQNILGPGYTLVFPVGIGAKYIYSDRFAFNAELGGRMSLSDGLDGYTSISSKANDIYYFLSISIAYRLKTGRNGLPKFMENWFGNRR